MASRRSTRSTTGTAGYQSLHTPQNHLLHHQLPSEDPQSPTPLPGGIRPTTRRSTTRPNEAELTMARAANADIGGAFTNRHLRDSSPNENLVNHDATSQIDTTDFDDNNRHDFHQHQDEQEQQQEQEETLASRAVSPSEIRRAYSTTWREGLRAPDEEDGIDDDHETTANDSVIRHITSRTVKSRRSYGRRPSVGDESQEDQPPKKQQSLNREPIVAEMTRSQRIESLAAAKVSRPQAHDTEANYRPREESTLKTTRMDRTSLIHRKVSRKLSEPNEDAFLDDNPRKPKVSKRNEQDTNGGLTLENKPENRRQEQTHKRPFSRAYVEISPRAKETHMGNERAGDDDILVEESQAAEEHDEERNEEDEGLNDEATDDTAKWEMQEMEEFERGFVGLEGRYQLLDKIGAGTFSSVYRAVDLEHDKYDNSEWDYDLCGDSETTTKESQKQELEISSSTPSALVTPLTDQETKQKLVAIKRIYVTSSPARIENEIAILHELSGHKNVVPLITAFRYKDQAVIVLPYFKHREFKDYFRDLTNEDIRSYMRSLMNALAHIHEHDIMHRDIKPSNFLYDVQKHTGVLVDFGLAQRQRKVVAPAENGISGNTDKSTKSVPSSLPAASTASMQPSTMADPEKHILSRPQDLRANAELSTTATGTASGKQSVGSVNDKFSTPSRIAAMIRPKQTSVTVSGKDPLIHPRPPPPSHTELFATQPPPQHSVLDRRPSTATPTPTIQQQSLQSPLMVPNTAVAGNKDDQTLVAARRPSVSLNYTGSVTTPGGAVAAGLVGQSASHGINPVRPNKPVGMNGVTLTSAVATGASSQVMTAGTSVQNAKREPGYNKQDKRPVLRVNRAGTRGFRAPEVLFKNSRQTVAIDVWSAGVILLSLLSGRFPFFNSTDDTEALLEIASIFGSQEMIRTAALHHRTFMTNIPSIKDAGMSLKKLCRVLNPSRFGGFVTGQGPPPPPPPEALTGTAAIRAAMAAKVAKAKEMTVSAGDKPTVDAEVKAEPTVAEVTKNLNPLNEDPQIFLLEASDLLHRLLALNPDERITAKEALQHRFLVGSKKKNNDLA